MPEGNGFEAKFREKGSLWRNHEILGYLHIALQYAPQTGNKKELRISLLLISRWGAHWNFDLQRFHQQSQIYYSSLKLGIRKGG